LEKESWKNLNIWKLADNLALRVYEITRNFPREEVYGVTSQLRRAALSIPTNIVEGYSRKGDKELAHFLSISFASLSEVKYLIHFSNNLGYLSEDEHKGLKEACDGVGRSLWAFYAKVKGSR
jgi:four helix bundle protein